jgi:thiamine-phosphate pyrophosphorylase
MAEQEHPQLYLITPPMFDTDEFLPRLAAILDKHDVACVRMPLAGQEDDILRAADAVRELCHACDIACVIDDHIGLVERLGLDGVHLTNGTRSIRTLRKDLGEDAIIGAFCAASRHDGMNAGEAGADYVSFGPVGDSALGNGDKVEPELFAWWTEMIELPVVAEGGLTTDLIVALAPITDFFAIGPEIWGQDDPEAALSALIAPLK